MSDLATSERIVARCRELASISDVPGETTRTFLSPATREAHALVFRWMQEAGMRVWTDAVGNVRGVLGREEAPRLVIGSHLDTVINAGAFDGPLGVVIGIELAERIASEVDLPFAVEVIGFSEEEGVRFGKPFLGSLAVVGEFDDLSQELRDRGGVSVADVVREFGLDVGRLAEAQLASGTFGYLEFHIEQGPLLEDRGEPVAVVNAIAGQTRALVRFKGQANHAGTSPMGRLRRDAVAAAAEWIVEVERYARGCEGLVATVGKIDVPDGAGNVIAGQCIATLDVRHAEDEVRVNGFQHLLRAANAAGAARGVTVTTEVLLEQAAVAMDVLLADLLHAACVKAVGGVVHRMTSGAGHDAMIVARRVKTAMLFLRSPGGLSHHPDEAVMTADVAAAYAAGLEFLRRLRDDGAILNRLVANAEYRGVRHA